MIRIEYACDKCGACEPHMPTGASGVIVCGKCHHAEDIPTPAKLELPKPQQQESPYLFFWKGPFSQWAKSNFQVGEFHYTCAEQYMMHRKALLFKDEDIAKQIMQAGFNPKRHKELGRLVKNFDAGTWNKHARAIVYDGSKAKFEQNPALMELLASTKGKTLVEASPFDDIWGIKMGPDDPNRFDESKWKGTNWLGQVLTTLRQKLIGE